MAAAVANPQTGVAPAAGGAQPMPSYPMASLYVGDLNPEVTEAMLFEKFSLAGPVLSIRVCRDAITRRSLGYAYVNFQQPADAERALDTMNFDPMQGKPIRIMWSQRDPSLRRSGVGNIFIKHLDKSIDNKAIHDTFSTFGTILSCKVVLDEKGQSRGYGFVHFDSEKSAKSAIEKVNGMLLNGKKVYAGMFEPRSAREKKFGESRKFQNVFIKNFKDTMTEEKLREMFGKYGDIESIYIARFADDDGERAGKAKGFGFVSFKSPDAAEKAVAEMNGSAEMAQEGSSGEGKLYVGRAQKKNERAAELKRMYEEKKNERMQKFQGVNLYVKNLVDDIDDDELERMFQKYGKITSAKVMRDDSTGRSRGFGFVCFEEAEDATRAVTEMNTKVVKDKPLYVALAQRKEERKSQLAAQYMQRLAQMRMHSALPGQMYAPGMGGHFVAAQGQPFGGQMRPSYGLPQQMGQMSAMGQRGMPQANWQQTRMQAMPQYGGVSLQQQQYAMRAQQQPMAGQMGVARPMAPTQLMGQRTMGPQSQQPQRQQTGMQQRGMQPGAVRPGMPMTQQYKGQGYRGDDAGLGQLANMPPQEQKQLIGEKLYPLVSAMTDPEKAGKVTGMLLEMENSELLMMLDDASVLRNKVNDAMEALLSSATR